jgi:hypothetical protein
MIILVSSVPMYGGFKGVRGHEKGTWSCLCQAPRGNVVRSIFPYIVFYGGGVESDAVEVGIILFAAGWILWSNKIFNRLPVFTLL